VLFRWLTLFLDFPGDSFDAGVAFWREVTGSALSPFRGTAGEFATLLPPDGDAYLRVQRIADGSGGVHLDLHADPAAGTVDQAADRAVALGATVKHASEGLVIAGSPGGFTFCLVRWHGENTVPRPVVLDPTEASRPDQLYPDTGGASRPDQLCLDIPPAVFERECAFWAALTGWDLRPGSTPEFAHLDRPAQLPLRLLFQRRDTADPLDQVTGHADFACARRDLLAQRHAASGARVLTEFPDWIAMADPTGRPYCLTGRDPETGQPSETAQSPETAQPPGNRPASPWNA
jgi:glyoxalase superfamily protein